MACLRQNLGITLGGCIIYSERERARTKAPPIWKNSFFGGGELGRVIGDGTVLHHIGHFLFKLILATTALEIYTLGSFRINFGNHLG